MDSILGELMKLYLAVILLVSMPAVMAAGNLTVESASLAPSFINTENITNMLNLTLNATVGNITVSTINVTVVGVNNVSTITVYNKQGSLVGTGTVFNSTTNTTSITLTGVSVNVSENNTMIIAVSMLSNATLRNNVALNISSSMDIGVDVGSNVSITSSSIQSGNSQVQDLHANATITPLYIDTSIINQTVLYNIDPQSRDSIFNISITVPTEYEIVNVTEVKQGGSTLYNQSTSIVQVLFDSSTGLINLTNTAESGFSTTGTIVVNISTNSSSSSTTAEVFNSTITGSNLSLVIPGVVGTNTSVTTQQLVNVTGLSILKGAALANGTDYWEFRFRVNFTANVTGNLQFKMTDWNNSNGDVMRLRNSSGTNVTHYTTLYDNANSSIVMNVSNIYNSSGILPNNCCKTGTIYTLILRMIIPIGTPSSSSWYSTYGILFRSL